jgi:hypothetical protein
MWRWFWNEVDRLGPFDMVLHNAETLDGPGKKSTLDLWTTDMEEQADDAVDVLSELPTDTYRLTYGSNYHSVGESKHEHMVVRGLREKGYDASIAKHKRFEVNGVKFDAAHKVGGSRTAYAQGTQLAKGAVIDMLRQVYNEQDPADVYIRSHNHYYYFVGNDMYAAYQTPCMEWPFGTYGTEVDGPFYTVGFLHITVADDGEVTVRPKRLRAQIPDAEYEVLSRRGDARN